MVDLVKRFLQLEAASGIILFFTAVMALILANSPWSELYFSFLDVPVQLRIGDLDVHKPLLLWINDGLMAVFFLLVGMEIKREVLEGSLSTRRQAGLPVIAAIGGMIVPAVLFSLVVDDTPQLMAGWAIPMATDIAFALGVLSLLSGRIPLSLKVFLLALAIIDDLGAILVIALFYTETLHTTPLLFAAALSAILLMLNRNRVMSLTPYLIIGGLLWLAILKSGIHATIAGVILGFTIPHVRGAAHTPLRLLEHKLHPWSSYFILPFFAFANAGLSFSGVSWSDLGSGLPLAIIIGLIIGKPLGVMLVSWLAVKAKLAVLPENVGWYQLFGLSVLCGIGFTMSIFISGLAFGTTSDAFASSRLGILFGSLIAAVFGYILLRNATRIRRSKERKRVSSQL
ncbi:Na+/H+ antiporter NhaA [Tolumonas osonensis]|uniref:Na(+)/H(+) antiporter NhaA n=1 Tax=Tolumonas osonensis TaxID=675874 RepID=A0A841GSJ8_9GAMM|nr:Na+/H+ antiporter NhaA [Tolumonas osonensis]MBB6056783.1 NhaA family Na+:H+ antiporter [Tolumonas osonensis]